MSFETISYLASFDNYWARKRALNIGKQAKFFYLALEGLKLEDDSGESVEARVCALDGLLKKAKEKGWDLNVIHPTTGLAMLHQLANLVRYKGSVPVLHCLIDNGANLDLLTQQGSTFVGLISTPFKESYSAILAYYEQLKLQKNLPECHEFGKVFRL